MKVLNRSTNPYYGDVVAARLTRRAALGGIGGVAAGAWVAALLGSTAIRNTAAAATAGSTLTFPELKRVYDQTHHVAPGYDAAVLIKWGDPLFADSPTFDYAAPTPEQQLAAFGYNCDFIGFVPLPEGSAATEHGLLCVNHEYISPNAMFPGMTEDDAPGKMTEQQVKVEMAAVGHSIVEVRKENGAWAYVQGSPVTGRVYAVMTKNKNREPGDENPANPRAQNAWGHILELIPPGTGKDADVYQWDILLLAGDPADPAVGAKLNPATSKDGWLVTPDNIAFDPRGRAWICTDGANDFDLADGVYACDTEGEGRALTRLFFACPSGAEATGACFTPDGRALFLSVQHPGENSETLASLTTHWPTMDPNLPPMPAVVAFGKQGGGEIGA